MDEPAYYELIEVLGEGGMGRVYRAAHQPSGAEVAIKVLRSEFKRDRFRRRLLLDEATAAAKLDHPRIVRLLDVGQDDDGAPFLVMELAEGEPLDGLVARWVGFERLGPALLDVLEGLAAAHAAGIVHRDLKLGNVIVDPKSGRASILDFGVASLVDPLRDRGAAMIVGTPEFMPPEQLSGDGPIGPWTDLYAFGVLLAEVVRGGSPFAGFESLTALLLAKSTHVPPQRFEVREGLTVPRALHDLIERLLRPHPRARPRFAVEVRGELAGLLAQVKDAVEVAESEASAKPTSIEDRSESTASRLLRSAALTQASGEVGVPPRGEASDALFEAHAPVETSAALVLPAFLPAADDLALGAGIARLREIPLAGREEERRELTAMVDEVLREGGARLVAYVGEAGIGKSRLARWGLGHVEATGKMDGAAGGYDPSGADVALGLRHALRRLVGMPQKAVKEALRWLASEPGLDVERLARFLRADEGEATLSADHVVHLAHAALRAAGRMRPIYLWLDDLGWARDGAIDLVEALLEQGDVPVLVVATMRAGSTQHASVRERLERILRHPRARVREVRALDRDARARMLEGVAPLAPGVAGALAERIEGSPLLLASLVHDWRGRGLLEPDGAVYRPRDGASVDELLVLRPLAALLGDRVEELLGAFEARGPLAVEVLGRAALLGARFEHAALRAACARDPRLRAAMDEVLDRALLVGVVRAEREGVYAFDHALVQEGLVARVEAGPQRGLALVDAANGLQSRYGKERADIASLVAGLLHRAGDRDRAWERQHRAIERSAWVADDRAASMHLAVARAWVAEEPEREARVELAEARVHYFALRYDRALEAVARARAMADPVLAMQCDALEADVLYYQDRFRASQRIAERCVASTGEDPELADVRAQASQRLAELAVLRGDLGAALVWRQHTQACAEVTGRAWRVRIARLNVAEILAVAGQHEEAAAICEAALADARADRDEDAVTASRESLACIDVLAGRAERSRAFLERRALELEASRDGWRLSAVLPYTALIAAFSSSGSIVEAEVRRMAEAFRAVPHDEAFTFAAMRRLAALLLEQGRFALAREVDALLDARAERYRVGFSSS